MEKKSTIEKNNEFLYHNTELLLKKYRKNLEDPKGIERAIRALMRRGYAYGDIRSVLKQLAEEE